MLINIFIEFYMKYVDIKKIYVFLVNINCMNLYL